jgi:hypothetical protein
MPLTTTPRRCRHCDRRAIRVEVIEAIVRRGSARRRKPGPGTGIQNPDDA